MTLPDFIAHWQAQPFRAFRLHTPRGIFTVNYPLAAALSPQLQVIVVAGDSEIHAEIFSIEEIEHAEAFGRAMPLDEAIGAVAPLTLARDMQLIASAQESLASAQPAREQSAPRIFDPGKVSLLGAHATDGVFLVQAVVSEQRGQPIFGTADTRWNLHGVESFENGTSLYLHHLDHPAVEQRVIIWPPATGTFESFSEATSLVELSAELKKRDAVLAASPAKPTEPAPAYFRKIMRTYSGAKIDGFAAAFGEEGSDDDFDRFEIHLIAHKTFEGAAVNNPVLIDVPGETILFNLGETEWDATFERGTETIGLTLSYPSRSSGVLKLTIDPYGKTARVGDDATQLPLVFVERHLLNYVLYESWDLMRVALQAGPVNLMQPDIVLPLAEGFSAELWAGESRFPLPFLQPRFLSPTGATLLDLRDTAWAAYVGGDETKPVVNLRFISHEPKQRYASERYELRLDLVTHRVTSPGLKGSTTLGMIQSMVRRVRGVKWLSEDLEAWFAKGRLLPSA